MKATARTLALAAALALAGPIRAHDTWLQPLPDTARGERLLALGTGERFPQQQSPLPMAGVRDAVCHALLPAPDGTPFLPWPLRWAADRPDALWLRSTRPVPPALPLDCRVPMQPQPLELPADGVAAYLDEARADASVRARWQALQQRGLPWRERYRKHARWLGSAPDAGATPPAATAATTAATTAAAAMAFDVQLQLPRWPLQRGDRASARLLLQGQPLPHHAVELRNDQSPIGLWLKSDADGRLELPLPLAARWMLRSIVLQPGPADDWDSHFLSVVFDVAPAANVR